MSYTLFVGDYTYSSWSLRGWLLMDAFGIARKIRYAALRTPEFEAMQADMAPGRLVPAVRLPDGQIVWDSLAIAETLAERHPDAGHWPADPGARAAARVLVAEMHGGFMGLRGACPMNMRAAYADFAPSQDVLTDLDQIKRLWAYAREFGGKGPYLFGAYSVADAFYTPVASRIATYKLPVDGADADYVQALISHPSVRRWRAMGVAKAEHQAHYAMDLTDRPDPHQPALTGTVIPGDPSKAENADCPYSGGPVAADCLVQINDQVIGYCNPFCAAKTAADPMAWPPTVALLKS